MAAQGLISALYSSRDALESRANSAETRAAGLEAQLDNLRSQSAKSRVQVAKAKRNMADVSQERWFVMLIVVVNVMHRPSLGKSNATAVALVSPGPKKLEHVATRQEQRPTLPRAKKFFQVGLRQA